VLTAEALTEFDRAHVHRRAAGVATNKYPGNSDCWSAGTRDTGSGLLLLVVMYTANAQPYIITMNRYLSVLYWPMLMQTVQRGVYVIIQ
jgi:hypothetical protein